MGFRFCLPLIICLSLTHCTSLGPRFTPAKKPGKNEALVYLYRVPRFAGSAGSPYVCLDGNVVGENADGGYLPLRMNSGRHKLTTHSLGSEKQALAFQVRGGRTYYLRSDFSALKTGTGGGLLGDAIWAAGSDEEKKIAKAADKTVRPSQVQPWLLFVNKNFAMPELKKNKLFEVPRYSKNHCAPVKKSSSQVRGKL